MLDTRRFIIAIVVSPATIFLLLLGFVHAFYVPWATHHAIEVAETHLNTQGGYTVKIDSVSVSLTSIMFFKVHIFEDSREIAEIASLVLYEPSLISFIFQHKLIASHVELGLIQTHRADVRHFLEGYATFFSDSP